jgi:hypothetical protein
VSLYYWTTWPSLVLAHFWFLIDHVSGPCCSSCRFSIGTRVVLSMSYVSLLHWTMCLIFIGRCGRFLFDHVSRCYPSTFHFFYSATWLDNFLPCVGFLLAHVLCHDYFTCHAVVRPRVTFLFDHVACSGSTTCSIINSLQK